MKKAFLFIIITSILTSCATRKQIVYFQDIDALNLQQINQTFEPIIEPNDILHISISSISEEVIKPFLKTPSPTANVGNTNPGLQGYLVSKDGLIRFPVIGDVQVAGDTREQVIEKLKSKLTEYVKDVVVDVRIMNFDVTILGEVNNPGKFNVKDERVTLPEAIALAGDFSEDGRRDQVTVIREIDGVRQVARIDFTKADFFSSPFYFLKQNDVVYIEPTLKGVRKSGFIPDVPALLSLVTIVLSTVILLTR
jgi:polysaccharide export outer membrane protein